MSHVLQQSARLLGCAVLMAVATCVLGQTSAPSTSAGQTAPIPDNVKAHHENLNSLDYHGYKNIIAETKAGRDVDFTTQRFIDEINDSESMKLMRDPKSYPNPLLRGISCSADAIVTAVPTYAETDISRVGDFLFTDYRFQVQSVVKNKTPLQLQNNTEVIVTRAGGDTTINGHRVRIQIVDFPQFTIGRSYLLFLQYLSVSSTFQAFGVGTFELLDNGAVPFEAQRFANVRSLGSQSAFLTEVRAAATAPCTALFSPLLPKTVEERQ